MRRTPKARPAFEGCIEKEFTANGIYGLKVFSLTDSGTLILPARYGAGIIVEGSCRINGEEFAKGEPFFLAAGTEANSEIHIDKAKNCEIALVQSCL